MAIHLHNPHNAASSTQYFILHPQQSSTLVLALGTVSPWHFISCLPVHQRVCIASPTRGCTVIVMRLHHTKTLKVWEFVGSNVPSYAILSHTWGKEEVTFQDMQTSRAEHKAGYSKLRGCCSRAAKDGYVFVWIDTCWSVPLPFRCNSISDDVVFPA